MLLRDGRGGFTHAEADLDNLRRGAAEQAIEVEGCRREWHAVDGKQLFTGTPLRVGDAPLAQDVTADWAPFLQRNRGFR